MGEAMYIKTENGGKTLPETKSKCNFPHGYLAGLSWLVFW